MQTNYEELANLPEDYINCKKCGRNVCYNKMQHIGVINKNICNGCMEDLSIKDSLILALNNIGIQFKLVQEIVSKPI